MFVGKMLIKERTWRFYGMLIGWIIVAIYLNSTEYGESGIRELQEVEKRYVIDSITGHKTFYPVTRSDIVGILCAIIGLMIAAGGGIGGGGMLVPIYVLVLGFEPKFAIPLSNVTVLGGAITNVLMNAAKRHPLADRPLVDWDLLILMEPLTLAGALAGGFINKLAPEIVLTVMLVILLGLTTERTAKKGIKLYKKETEIKNAHLSKLAAEASASQDAEAGEALLGADDNTEEDENPSSEEEKRKTIKIDPELKNIIDEEKETAPLWKVQVLLGMFILIVAINLAKGGGAFPSPLGIVCGSFLFWASTAFMFIALIGIAFYVRNYLVARTADKDRLGYNYVDGDFHWDATSSLKYPAICFFAGMCAGLFGIGGGIVNGPLMLELGVLPPVASATTACMILLTSTTAATTFIVFGLLAKDYGFHLFWVGVLATAVGQLGMSYLIKKSGRQSYVAFSIGAVVGLSTILMGFHGLISLAYQRADADMPGTPHHRSGICQVGD
uniref:Uncharacterized protein n=1 Tax=Aureoumbra lagunensis TaxID=44058 RepID=A0A7S3K149_9STRA|mmetsp:Transcript_16881/g.25406  ORF Transcript_16881/g.25406 Transcript_16881/m.25406 type:complete len:499 (+) Transcript_16881:35-1531(+)